MYCVFCIVIHMMDRRIARFTYRTLESEGCKSVEKKRAEKRTGNNIRTISNTRTELRFMLLRYRNRPDKSRVCSSGSYIIDAVKNSLRFTNVRDTSKHTYRREHINFFLFSLFFVRSISTKARAGWSILRLHPSRPWHEIHRRALRTHIRSDVIAAQWNAVVHPKPIGIPI